MNNQQNTEPKVADLFVNVAQTGTIPDFDLTMNQGVELVLEQPDTYWKNDDVKKMFSDEKGNPDKKKFDEYYNQLSGVYNQYAGHELDVRRLENLAFDTPVSRLLGMETISNPTTFNTRNINIFDQATGAVGINKQSDRSKTIQEVMDSQNFYFDTEKQQKVKQGDAISGAFDFISRSMKGDVLVAAQWEADGEHTDPLTGTKAKHKKGDYKIDPETLKPYRETLAGRDVTGKDVMAFGNNLTEEGSSLNAIDFMDSDDIEKSIAGTIAKTTAEIGIYFIPYVGKVYAATQLSKNLMNSGAEVYKSIAEIIDGSNNAKDKTTTANQIQGLLSGFTTTGMSEAGRDNPFGFESLASITSSIVSELFTQTAAATMATKLGALASPTKVAEYLNKTGSTNRLKGTLDMLGDDKALREVLGESYKNFETIGAASSYLYNVMYASKEIADIADEAGLNAKDKGMLHALSIAGLGTIYKYAGFDSWFLEGTGIGSDVSNGIRKALRTELGDLSFLKNLPPTEKVKEATTRLNKVFNAFKDPDFARTYAGAAVSEAMEENTEVVFAEGLKSLYNTLQDNGMTFTEDKTKRFKDLFGEQFFTELAMSTIAGGLGGVAFRAAQAKQTLNPSITDYIQMGYKDKITSIVNKEHRNGNLGSTKLSTMPLEISPNGITWKAADKGDSTHNDFARDLLLKQVEDTSLFLTKEGYDHEGIIALQNKIKDAIKLESDDISDEDADKLSKYYGKKIYLDEKLDTSVKDDVNRLTKQLVNYEAQIQKLKGDISENSPVAAQDLSRLEAKKQEVKEELDSIFSILRDNKSDKLDYYTRKSLFSITTNLPEFSPLYKTKSQFFAEKQKNANYQNLSNDEKLAVDEQIGQDWVGYLLNTKKGAVTEAFNAFERFEKTKPFSNFKKFLEDNDSEFKPNDVFKSIYVNQDLEKFLNRKDKIGISEQIELQKQLNEVIEQYKELEATEVTEENAKELSQQKMSLNIAASMLNDRIQLKSIDLFLKDEKITDKSEESFIKFLKSFPLSSKLKEKAKLDRVVSDETKNKIVEELINFLKTEKITDASGQEMFLIEEYAKEEALASDKEIILSRNQDDSIDENNDAYKNLINDNREYFKDNINNINEIESLFNNMGGNPYLLKFLKKNFDGFFTENDYLVSKVGEKANFNYALPTDDIFSKPGKSVNKLIEELIEKKESSQLNDVDGSLEDEILKAIDSLKKHKSFALATFAYNPTVNAFRASSKAPQAIRDLPEDERFKFLFNSKQEVNRLYATATIQDVQYKLEQLEELLNSVREATKSNITEVLRQSIFEIARVIKSLKSVSNNNKNSEFDRLINELKSKIAIPNEEGLKTAYAKLKEAQNLFKESIDTAKIDALKKGFDDEDSVIHDLTDPNGEITEHSMKTRVMLANSFERITNFDDILAVIKTFAENNQDYASMTIQDFSIIQVLSYLQNPEKTSPINKRKERKEDTGQLVDALITNGISLNQSGGFGKTSTLIKNAVDYEHRLTGGKTVYTSVGTPQINALEKGLGNPSHAERKESYQELFGKFGIPFLQGDLGDSVYEINDGEEVYPRQNTEDLDRMLGSIKDDESVTLIVLDEATRMDFSNIYLLDKAVGKINDTRKLKNKPLLKVIYSGDSSQLSATRLSTLTDDRGKALLDSSIFSLFIETTPSIDYSFRTNYKYIADVNSELKKNLEDTVDKKLESRTDPINSFYYDKPNLFTGVSFTKNNTTYKDHIVKLAKTAKANNKKLTIFNSAGNDVALSETLKSALTEAGLTNMDYEIINEKDVQGGEWDYIVVDSVGTYPDIVNSIFNQKRQLYTINTRAKSAIVYSPSIPLLSSFIKPSIKANDDFPPIVQNLRVHETRALNTVLQHRDAKLKALEDYSFTGEAKKPILESEKSEKSGSKTQSDDSKGQVQPDEEPETILKKSPINIPLFNYRYEMNVENKIFEEYPTLYDEIVAKVLLSFSSNKDELDPQNDFEVKKVVLKVVDKKDSKYVNSINPNVARKAISEYTREGSVESEFKTIPILTAFIDFNGQTIEVPISHAYGVNVKNNIEYEIRKSLEEFYKESKAKDNDADVIMDILESNTFFEASALSKQEFPLDNLTFPGYVKSPPIALTSDRTILGVEYKKGDEFVVYKLNGLEGDFTLSEINEILKKLENPLKEDILRYRLIKLNKEVQTYEKFEKLLDNKSKLVKNDDEIFSLKKPQLNELLPFLIRKQTKAHLLASYLMSISYSNLDFTTQKLGKERFSMLMRSSQLSKRESDKILELLTDLKSKTSEKRLEILSELTTFLETNAEGSKHPIVDKFEDTQIIKGILSSYRQTDAIKNSLVQYLKQNDEYFFGTTRIPSSTDDASLPIVMIKDEGGLVGKPHGLKILVFPNIEVAQSAKKVNEEEEARNAQKVTQPDIEGIEAVPSFVKQEMLKDIATFKAKNDYFYRVYEHNGNYYTAYYQEKASAIIKHDVSANTIDSRFLTNENLPSRVNLTNKRLDYDSHQKLFTLVDNPPSAKEDTSTEMGDKIKQFAESQNVKDDESEKEVDLASFLFDNFDGLTNEDLENLKRNVSCGS